MTDQPPTNRPTNKPADAKSRHPFRRAVLRGLALILPPLLTIVVFLWAWHIIEDYVLVPLESTARGVIVWNLRDTRDAIPDGAQVMITKDGEDRLPLATPSDGSTSAGELERLAKAAGGTIVEFKQADRVYSKLENGKQWIPTDVYDVVVKDPGERLPDTADGFYGRYVDVTWLRRELVIPIFLCVFVLFLYLLGKFLAAGVGRILWNAGESIVHRLPIIRNVYSSVKQVTDFALSERELSFNRIVAVQYPRKGIWSLGFVTGQGMKDVADRAGEPVLAVLMPTSPMPATGFTIMVPKSEAIELDITMDQAIQFIVSCGVVTPPHQQQHAVAKHIAAALSQQTSPLSDDAALTST
jgi:uncharacterized membrane protein